jgi:hypothetical protein
MSLAEDTVRFDLLLRDRAREGGAMGAYGWMTRILGMIFLGSIVSWAVVGVPPIYIGFAVLYGAPLKILQAVSWFKIRKMSKEIKRLLVSMDEQRRVENEADHAARMADLERFRNDPYLANARALVAQYREEHPEHLSEGAIDGVQ